MLCRERTMNALTFRPVDRLPLVEWPIRRSTMDAWIGQGYPEGVDPQTYFSLDTLHIGVPVSFGMRPPFEEEVLERTGEYKIWRDALGAVRKDFVGDATPGFVTRTWLSFAVTDRTSFHRMRERYRAEDAGRYPPDWSRRARGLGMAQVPVHLSIPFLFWVARDWMGLEGLCTAFYDDPALVEEMFEFIAEFSIATLERGLHELAVDLVELKEDMAYKGAPMISPAMFRRFMAPGYRRIVDYLKARGARLVYVDCDGNPEELIPAWRDVGVDAMSPCEAAAGVDPVGVGRSHPGFAMFGGIDKRVLARSRADIHREVASKVQPMLGRGGFVPHVDHAFPPDVPLESYLYYRELMAYAARGQPLPPLRLE
jgi:hypothetical protein